MAEVRRINLALQGGGAHGAFTWGVLDRLLEEEDLEIAGISGTSAGALNGAALKSGLIEGGAPRAREVLGELWARIGAVGDMRMPAWMAGFAPDPGILAKALAYSPGFSAADALSRTVSPYVYGPFYRNPLAPIAEGFNYGEVCAEAGPALFVGATNVRTGKVRVFSGADIGPEAILASACLPTLFQAVPVRDPETGETEHFWDGGYTGNPALFPLFAPELPDDIVVVNINPLERDGLPVTPQEIQNRINEISFNSSLLRELRAIAFVQRLVDSGRMPAGAMKRVRMHMIADDDLMNRLSVATKLVPLPGVIAELFEAGRGACDGFLAAHGGDLTRRQTLDLAALYD
ncbi:patatin-like phospholipase family protein [Rhodosalinus sediminis]|uniref:patatin-like phospholipase family protein n=1 Tax=Rhodosalinus sediminis TaxID=1940533 RepID=UPI002354FCCB|nr:patatin-like phospholipase family protein [Rhodosalinus sediminis]